MNSSRASLVLVCLFGAFLAAPWVDALVRESALRGPLDERRSAAPLPAWPRDSIALMRFPAELERAFGDRFGLRDVLLRWNSLQMLQVFRTFPAPRVVLGRGGFLFYTGEDSLPVLRGLMPFTEGELREWYRQIEAHRAWCAERGITYLLVIGPNKETNYADKLPECWDKLGPTRLEQLQKFLPSALAACVLDLRPALLADRELAGDAEPSYFPLSTHWTDRGALVASREILRALARERPALGALELDEFDASASVGPGESWAPAANIPQWMHQHVLTRAPRAGARASKVETSSTPYGCVNYECKAAAPLSVAVIHDSFGPRVCEYLAEHCARLVSASWDGIDETLVEREKPDILIELYVERRLLVDVPRIARVR